MLEVVHVDVAAVEADIGRNPVAELDQLHFQALLVGFFNRGFQRNGKGRGGADLQRLGSKGTGAQAEGDGNGRDGPEQFLKHGAGLQSGQG
ncbi:hypothetical protein D3C79_559420 [compost metagenome]